MFCNMASSSIVPPKEESYDVFLSFRGPDTRQTFITHLYAALIRRKVKTFIDYRLERGDEVGPALNTAIKKSKISVLIFSENYASSTWCLDELAYILKCKEIHGQRVIPIFYKVEPSLVRRQTGIYETAFAKHEQRLKDNPDKVAKWKGALKEAANLSGFDSKVVGDDHKLIEEVVSDVLAKLKREPSIDLTRLIGAEGRIQKILLELDIIPEDVRVRCVVLWGPGGIGKTTLAEAVFHGLFSQFEAQCCFLPNIRTRSRSGAEGAFSLELYDMRNELVRELLGDRSLTISTPTIGASVKRRLFHMKVLVVLDDVNHSNQFTFLVREVPFGPGSRIIITTRDLQPVKETLQVKNVGDYDVKIYEVEELNGVESLQLLHSNGPAHFTENLEFLKVVDHAAGIPLALKVLCGYYHRCKSREELAQLWDRLKKFPDHDLQKVYRASFDGLKTNEREIFLDLACFHKGAKLYDAKRILADCGLFPEIGIDILIDMSLISIKDSCIWMHDVIQEMGWEIVCEESPYKPEERSRLHNYDDGRRVLEGNKGTAKVLCISYLNHELKLDPRAFTKMDNLRFLALEMKLDDDKANLERLPDARPTKKKKKEIEYLPDALHYLHWFHYPFKSLPSKFSPDNLVELHMCQSKLKRLWGKSQNLENLKRIDLSYSLDLAAIGELSNSVNIESINLAGCEILVQVPPYFEKFTKLTHLDLQHCSKLRSLPNLPGNIESLDLIGTAIGELTQSVCSLEKLRRLDLNSCSSIKKFSSSPWKMRSLNHLGLRRTKIKRVPSSSFLCMTGIISLDSRDCDRLVSLPADICELKSLDTLDLSGCLVSQHFRKLPSLWNIFRI